MSDESTPARSGFKQTLRFTIVTIFSTLLVATVLAVILTGHRQSSATQRALTDELFERVTAAVRERTQGFLAPAAALIELHADQLGGGLMRVEAPQEQGPAESALLDSFVGILRRHPALAFVYFAAPDGSQLAVERLGPDRFTRAVLTPRESGGSVIDRITVDSAGARLDLASDTVPEYNTQEEAWFVDAREQDRTIWTDPYLFLATHRMLGITASRAARAPDGSFGGVFAVDLDLVMLSSFLARLKLASTGGAMLAQADGRMIAFPGYVDWLAEHPEATLPPLAGEIGMPFVVDAIQAAGAGPDHLVHIHDGRRWLVRATLMPTLSGAEWYVVVAAPEDEFVGPLWETNRRILLGTLVALLLGMLAVSAVSRRISQPIVALAAQTQRVKDLDLSPATPIRSRIWEVQLLSDAVESMKVGLGAFVRYMPSKLVQQVIEAGVEVEVGGREVELTLFFSDVQGFTTISEGLEPQALAELLSEYLDVVTRTLHEHGATVDKYIGDGVMAFWGAPLPDEDHVDHACRAAVECQRRLDELNARWKAAGRPELITRIGLHTGRAVVGNVGSSERLSYTAMGDNVNIAARLEGANKQFGTRILISEVTCSRLGEGFRTRALGEVELKGKTVPMRVFELQG